MSGPIVRRYGFPNYEKIFGKKELAHGVEGPNAPSAEAQIAKAAGVAPPTGSTTAPSSSPTASSPSTDSNTHSNT